MRKVLTILGFSATLLAGGCASTSGTSARPGFLSYDDCFFANTMTDWRPLDSMNLVVFTGRRQPYHIQLSMRSMSLRYEDTIAFTDRDGRICAHGGDAIVINGDMPDRISIASVRRLTEAQLEDLYRSYGIRGPEVVEAPAPPPEDE